MPLYTAVTPPEKTLIVIVGPTAVGKTQLAIQLAEYYGTVIISADSRQFYQELRIGSGAPTSEELARVKQFLLGHLSVTDYYNVAKFEQDALHCIQEQHRDKDLLILAGGSGLYIDAVCKGIDELPDPDPSVRRMIAQWFADFGIGYLQDKLKALDPEYYHAVDKNNPKRLMRALEVCLITGTTFSSLRHNQPKSRPFTIIKIGLNLPRDLLIVQINQRVEEMIARGLVEEARQLLPYRNYNALNTVGYKELFQYFDGHITLEQAIEKIKINTRRYAKRQLTWFKKDREIKWFQPGELEQIVHYINLRMKKEG